VLVAAEKLREHLKSVAHISRPHFSTSDHGSNDATEIGEVRSTLVISDLRFQI
jgi:hypothetical protein